MIINDAFWNHSGTSRLQEIYSVGRAVLCFSLFHYLFIYFFFFYIIKQFPQLFRTKFCNSGLLGSLRFFFVLFCQWLRNFTWLSISTDLIRWWQTAHLQVRCFFKHEIWRAVHSGLYICKRLCVSFVFNMLLSSGGSRSVLVGVWAELLQSALQTSICFCSSLPAELHSAGGPCSVL